MADETLITAILVSNLPMSGEEIPVYVITSTAIYISDEELLQLGSHLHIHPTSRDGCYLAEVVFEPGRAALKNILGHVKSGLKTKHELLNVLNRVQALRLKATFHIAKY